MVPLLIILIYNNWYAMNVVCNQVAGSNRSLVQIQSNQIDNMLSDMERYLHNMAFQDPDIIYINSDATETVDDYYANIKMLNKIQNDLFEYNYVHAIFVYKTLSQEFITASQTQDDIDKANTKLGILLKDPATRKKLTTNWKLYNMDGQSFLLKLTDTGYGTYIGVWVNLDQLLEPIRFLEFSENTQVMFASSDGHVLTKSINALPMKTFSDHSLRKLCLRKSSRILF